MYVVGNRLVGNRVGLTTDSDHQEKLLPQQGAVVAGNLVAANQQTATPDQADGGWGIGVGVDGGRSKPFIHTRITGNTDAGVVITATQDVPPDDNQILDNTFSGNGIDLGWTFPNATKGQGNCVRGAGLHTVPIGLGTSAACPVAHQTASPSGKWTAPTPPAGIPFTDVAVPPVQPQFPNAAGSPATVVPAVPVVPDTAGVQVPTASLLAATALVQTS